MSTIGQRRREMKTLLRAWSRYLGAHIDHMTDVELCKLALLIHPLTSVHHETDCFIAESTPDGAR